MAIADRVGHESIDITYQYAHLFPSKQTEMADRLDDVGKGEFENVSVTYELQRPMEHQVYLSLGSNLGKREENLKKLRN